MSLQIGSSTANLRASKQYYKSGNPHTNMKDSNNRSMNLQQILRKSVSRLETDFHHKLIIIITTTTTTYENSW
jgi:hypothetical protein